MSPATEPTKTLTLLDIAVAVLAAVAPVAATIWVKLMLYRQRLAEDAASERLEHEPPRIKTASRTKPMKTRNIIMTSPDHARLSALLSERHFAPREYADAHALAAELERAQVVPSDSVPPDVITMNSRAELLDLDSGERMEFTVVFPDEADPADGRISVLAPVGAGMLGYRVGDTFERRAPDGMRRLKVVKVTYQPEAELAVTA